jgi:protein-S-isoprenylcysteine O-methyltransferase Ste14
MENEALFRVLFALVFGAVAVTRVAFHAALRTGRENVIPRTERPLTALLRGALGIPLLLSIVVYMFAPQWLRWAMLPLPQWLRWAGAALGAIGIPLLLWVHLALGRNFSPTLRVRTNHQLVLEGPYRWVRHPMYSALLVLHIAYFLLSENLLIGILGIGVMVVVMAIRTREEERLMLATFGEQYRAYMRRTGQFLPRLQEKL